MNVDIDINDIFIELSDENNRLLKELQLAQQFIKLLEKQRTYLIKCINKCEKCDKNKEILTKINEFESEFKSKIAKELVLKKDIVLKVNRKLAENNPKLIKQIKQKINQKIIKTNEIIAKKPIKINSKSKEDESEDNDWNSCGEESIQRSDNELDNESKTNNIGINLFVKLILKMINYF